MHKENAPGGDKPEESRKKARVDTETRFADHATARCGVDWHGEQLNVG